MGFQIDLNGQEIQEDYEKEWLEMPEFNNEEKSAYQRLIILFKTKEDVEKFKTIIQQNFTEKTKSIWYPEEKRKNYTLLRWQSDEQS